MQIALYASMKYADPTTLMSFFGDHAFAHSVYASFAGSLGSEVPVMDVADQRALFEWIGVMEAARGGQESPPTLGLQAWLEAHSALHTAELAALGINSSEFEISTVDFSDPSAFSDWMQTHADLHTLEDQRTGG